MSKPHGVRKPRNGNWPFQSLICPRCSKVFRAATKDAELCTDCFILTTLGMSEIGTKAVDKK